MTDKSNSEITDILDEQTRLERSGRLHWFHWFILVGSLFLTFGAWYLVQSEVEQKKQILFDREAEQIVALVSERMQKYEDALWSGVAAVHSQSHGIDYAEWKRFADTLKIEKKYPGINGIGIIFYVPQDDLSAFLEREREMRPDFKIHPDHNGNEYLPITYIEPQAYNAQAVGLDMAHEENRYTAALKARDSGKSQITAPITLVQDKEKTPGFLFYAPYYQEAEPETLEDRRDHFVGMVYAPFIFKQLMDGTLDRAKRSVGISIMDGDQVLYNEHTFLFPDFDAEPMLKKIINVEMYGRTWTFDIWSSLSFREKTKSSEPIVILLGGIVIDGLLLSLFIVMVRANHNAVKFGKIMASNYQQEAERLEEANAELEEFSYRTSHDLRAPLVASEGLLGVAIQSIQDGSTDVAVQSLEHVRKSMQKLLQLIQDLLVLTESKNIGEQAQTIDVTKMLDDVLENLKHTDGFDTIQVKKDIGHNIPVVSKKMRFRLILENLVSNAVKYRDPDKNDSFIAVSTRDEGNDFVLEVTDNGLGVPENRQSQMFTMFKRFHPQVSYGSGLGLYMIKKSAIMMGGDIVYKDTGDGSSFVFTLPRKVS